MRTFGNPSGIPIFYRLLSVEYFKNLLLVFSTAFLLSLFVSTLVFLNLAKEFSLSLLAEYAISSALAYTPIFTPLLAVLAVGFSLYPIVEKKLNWVIFTAGVSPKAVLKPFAVSSLFPLLFLFLYFEAVYPKAGYIQHLDYLRAKKKPIPHGVVKNFWFKTPEGEFLYFDLLLLDAKKAYNGRYFAVDKNFNLKWVVYIPSAELRFGDGDLIFTAKGVKKFSPRGVEVLKSLLLDFPFDVKLLKVRNPAYFSTHELVSLVELTRRVGINCYPYLWELIKRFLILLFTVLLPSVGAVYAFSAVKKEEFIGKMATLFGATLIFYVALLLFQTLVFKISVNPVYGLVIVLPYAVWAAKVLKGEG